MISNRSRISYFWVVAILVLLPACAAITTTPIKDILDNPRQYSGKELKIKGQVIDIFSLVVLKYFIVKDKTGEIAVVSYKPLPKKGETITVKGKVEEAFSIGDRQLIVLIEGEDKN